MLRETLRSVFELTSFSWLQRDDIQDDFGT